MNTREPLDFLWGTSQAGTPDTCTTNSASRFASTAGRLPIGHPVETP